MPDFPPPPEKEEDKELAVAKGVQALLTSQQDLRAMLLHVFLPQYTETARTLDAIKGIEDIGPRRGQVEIVTTVSKILKSVPLPPGCQEPNFAIQHENPKFVEFKKKLALCVWETGQKISFMQNALSATLPSSLNMIAAHLTRWWGIYFALEKCEQQITQ